MDTPSASSASPAWLTPDPALHGFHNHDTDAAAHYAHGGHLELSNSRSHSDTADANHAAQTHSGSDSDPYAPQHVLILYASETGDAADVAERVARAFRAAHRRAVLLSMEQYDVADLPHEALVIFITSTHGRGEPPPAMRRMWEKLIRKGLPQDILEDVHYALYGLGDSSYERFCFAGKMLARRLDGLGATALVEPAFGDERAPDGIEETLLPWLQSTLDAIVPYLPGPSTPALATTALPPPIYHLEPVEAVPDLSSLNVSNSTNGTAQPGKTASSPNGHAETAITVPTSYAPAGWSWATLRRNERVTARGWFQDTRAVELEPDDPTDPSLRYLPGAICALHPRSSDAEVSTFLSENKLDGDADRVFHIRSALPDQPLPPHLPSGPTTLRTLLTYHLDVRAPPRKSFFEWLRRLSPDEREQERADEFIQDPDEVHDYATRPKRTMLEALADFRHTTLPLEYVLEIVPPLRRRQFSIASDDQTHPGRIQLLVALVEFKTNLSIPRIGLCSSWLAALPIGTRIPFQLLPGTLNLPEPDVPVILVGPGTGVAPMRALLEARVRQGAAKNTALYFGCRSRTVDCYFEHEWEEYSAAGATVRIAPSRDGPEKVYVQHIIREDAAMVNDWIVKRNGCLFVCGSSNAMPREVRAALAWCISTDGAGTMSPDEAEAYVEAMFDTGRGAEESW